MGLMTGSGPLGKRPAGTFNFEPPPPGSTLYLEPSPKRVRVEVGGEVIADSRRVALLHESGLQPVYYFPPDDVRRDALAPGPRRTHCATKGEAVYFTITAGGRTVENGAWSYPDPRPGAPPIRDLIAFYFDRMGRWREEDEEIDVHPRDPYHRIDVLATARRIRISLGGTVLAETDRALALFESNLPPRWYLPREDVRAALRASDTVTHCPYKGEAHYFSVAVPEGEDGIDLVWFYSEPRDEVRRIRDLVCFYNEKVDIELDGEPQDRPGSPWSARYSGRDRDTRSFDHGR